MRGPGNVALVDRLLDADVAVSGPFGLDVPNGREALFQGAAGGDHRPGNAIGGRVLEELHVVAAGGGYLTLKKDMSVTIDEPGEHGGTAEVDQLRAGGDGVRSGGADGHDPICLDHNLLIRPRLRAGAVDEQRRTNDHRVRRCRAAVLRRAQAHHAPEHGNETDGETHAATSA